MSTGAVRIVCFDLGGVLVRICRSWTEACAAAGIEVRGDSATALVDEARFALTDHYSAGLLATDEWAAAVARAMGGVYTAAEVRKVHDAWTLDEYTGVGTLIDEIHEAGVATACLSNTNQAHWGVVMHLAGDGVGRRSDEPRYPAVLRLGRHYASHLLGLTKPSEAIYRAFERETATSGPGILFFDDLPENVRGARSCGWIAETVDPHGDTASEMRRALVSHGVLAPAAAP